ncbi:hypothetical protein BJ741DRAFT_597301 [Chytriomyces cf. hyalinus JEL632]|nr:hypothetical protein BJ741DRAFT_597301 [Chytriomyces cf. hyalinus JEL632]
MISNNPNPINSVCSSCLGTGYLPHPEQQPQNEKKGLHERPCFDCPGPALSMLSSEAPPIRVISYRTRRQRPNSWHLLKAEMHATDADDEREKSEQGADRRERRERRQSGETKGSGDIIKEIEEVRDVRDTKDSKERPERKERRTILVSMADCVPSLASPSQSPIVDAMTLADELLQRMDLDPDLEYDDEDVELHSVPSSKRLSSGAGGTGGTGSSPAKFGKGEMPSLIKKPALMGLEEGPVF